MSVNPEDNGFDKYGGPRANDSWRRLVEAAVAGDGAARSELAVAIGRLARAYFRRRGLGRRDAEELAISTVSDVILALGKYQDSRGRSFVAWVAGICRRKRADEFRRLYRAGKQLVDESAVVGRPSASAEELEATSVGEALEDALARLNPTDRRIVEARHARLPVEFPKLAEELKLDAALCRKRFERAMKKLRQLLERDPRTAELGKLPAEP